MGQSQALMFIVFISLNCVKFLHTLRMLCLYSMNFVYINFSFCSFVLNLMLNFMQYIFVCFISRFEFMCKIFCINKAFWFYFVFKLFTSLSFTGLLFMYTVSTATLCTFNNQRLIRFDNTRPRFTVRLWMM